MDYFHLEAKVVSRGAGRSVIAAAAYASCSKLYNDYDGLTHDYTKKRGCLYSEVFLPPQAPEEWKDRQLLWEAVETVETTKDSRLARELVLALPIELPLSEWTAMLEQFIREQGTDLGMCADVNIHDTDGHNPHSHILLTVRPLDEQGRWQAKTQKEYLCRRGEEERGFTAEEYKIAAEQGWEKQYMYAIGKKKEYMTPSEAELIEGCVRTSKTPKSTRYGRQNPISAQWNSEEQIFAWRQSWEGIINEAQERNGIPERVDCRSHAARGLAEQPTVHEGYYAKKLESMGIISDRCEMNRQIKEDNRILRELKRQVRKLMKAVKESIPAIAAALEGLREHMVILQFQLLVNESQQETLQFHKGYWSGILKEYQEVKDKIKTKNVEKKELIVEQKACGIHFIRARKLGEQIAALTEDIEELKFAKTQILSRLGCVDSEIGTRKQKVKELGVSLEKLKEQQKTLYAQQEEDRSQFLEIRNNIDPEKVDEVYEERAAIRRENRSGLIKRLKEAYQGRYHADTLEEAEKLVDVELQEVVVRRDPRSISEWLKAAQQEKKPGMEPQRAIRKRDRDAR